MNTRIKEVRKALHKTQNDFAMPLEVKGNYIYMVESGKMPVTERLTNSIVRAYNVNPEWLKTGEGEMFREMSVYEEIADYVAKLRNRPPDQFEVQLIASLARLSPEKWSLLEEIARETFGNSIGDKQD